MTFTPIEMHCTSPKSVCMVPFTSIRSTRFSCVNTIQKYTHTCVNTIQKAVVQSIEKLKICIKKRSNFFRTDPDIDAYLFPTLSLCTESGVQLGPGDGRDDPRIFLLGLHRHADPGRLDILEIGGKQVCLCV